MSERIITKPTGTVLQDHVGERITDLQGRFLRDQPGAVAELARLRRALQGAPGSDPTVWSLVFDQWPSDLAARSDEPSRAENAAHAAVCLYAIHQQGRRDEGMHRPGWSLGRSVGMLAARLGVHAESAVKRRFDAVATADNLAEILHHSRGLITQLRGEQIPLDYGLFAKHLYWLQSPLSGDHARLRWARDYYYRPDTAHTAQAEGKSS